MRKRPGLFNKAIEGIGHAREADLSVAISTYLTSEKYHQGHLQDMMALAQRLKVSEVTIFDAIPTGRMANGCYSHIH